MHAEKCTRPVFGNAAPLVLARVSIGIPGILEAHIYNRVTYRGLPLSVPENLLHTVMMPSA